MSSRHMSHFHFSGIRVTAKRSIAGNDGPGGMPLMSRSFMMLVAGCFLMFTACSNSQKNENEPAKEEEKKEESTFEAPALPDEEKDELNSEVITSELMVNDSPASVRGRKPAYIHDTKIRTGDFVAYCYVPGRKNVDMPFITVEAGFTRAKKPVWHRSIRRNYLERDNGRRRYGVVHAVLRFRDVGVGHRPPLSNATYKIMREGLITPGLNYANLNVAFSAQFNRIQFINYELFPVSMSIKPEGQDKALFTASVRGYNDPKHPGAYYGDYLDMPVPSRINSNRLKETGVYTLASNDYPGLNGYLFVADNPYVGITRYGGRGAGKIEIEKIPAGTYTVDVWHPRFKPKQNPLTVEIKEDETIAINVEFETPEELRNPTPRPSNIIQNWAVLDPLQPAGKDAVELKKRLTARKLSSDLFKGTEKGRLGRKAYWQKCEIDAKETVNLHLAHLGKEDLNTTVTYAAVWLDSDLAQEVALDGQSARAYDMWLNGNLLHTTGRSYSDNYRTRIVTMLKKGRNSLVMRIGHRKYIPGFSWGFSAKGEVKAVCPDIPSWVHPVREWAVLGPFSNKDNAAATTKLPPEKNLDFKAEIKGMGDEILKWKKVGLSPRYKVAMLASCYTNTAWTSAFYALQIESPSSQYAFFRMGWEGSVSIQMNGSAIRIPKPNSTLHHRHLFKAKLKKGKNTLLVKLNNGKGRPGLGAVIKAKGIKVRLPEGVK